MGPHLPTPSSQEDPGNASLVGDGSRSARHPAIVCHAGSGRLIARTGRPERPGRKGSGPRLRCAAGGSPAHPRTGPDLCWDNAHIAGLAIGGRRRDAPSGGGPSPGTPSPGVRLPRPGSGSPPPAGGSPPRTGRRAYRAAPASVVRASLTFSGPAPARNRQTSSASRTGTAGSAAALTPGRRSGDLAGRPRVDRPAEAVQQQHGAPCPALAIAPTPAGPALHHRRPGPASSGIARTACRR